MATGTDKDLVPPRDVTFTPLEEEWWSYSQDDKGNLEKMKKLLEENPTFDVDSSDATGMTALMHASFRGHAPLCRYLLEKGADVNSDVHTNKYTCLMFGSMSGVEEVVVMLLEAGAKTEAINGVRRTASEMSAFVGQYHICSIILNYYPSKELEKFTVVSGGASRPKLKKELLKPFHAIINSYNIHPIFLVRELHKTPGLLDDAKYLREILDKLSADKMSPHGTHETLAFKFHYLSCIIEHTARARASAKDGSSKPFLTKLATGRASDGFLEQVELLVRSTLKSYPRPDSKLFHMLLQKVNKVKIGDEPTAFAAVTEAIGGNRMRTVEDIGCDVCACFEPKNCQKCKYTLYCSRECQKLHWPTHKKFCKEPPPMPKVDI